MANFSLVERYKHFGVTCYLHHQSTVVNLPYGEDGGTYHILPKLLYISSGYKNKPFETINDYMVSLL
jgi:hypothetical protein